MENKIRIECYRKLEIFQYNSLKYKTNYIQQNFYRNKLVKLDCIINKYIIYRIWCMSLNLKKLPYKLNYLTNLEKINCANNKFNYKCKLNKKIKFKINLTNNKSIFKHRDYYNHFNIYFNNNRNKMFCYISKNQLIFF